MIGIPRFTSVQKMKISAEVADALKELPAALADLIAGYTDENAFAGLQLELEAVDPDHPGYEVVAEAELPSDSNLQFRVIDNPTNKSILAAIRKILISEGEQSLKRIIVENLDTNPEKLNLNGTEGYVKAARAKICRRNAVTTLIAELREEKLAINLDGVDFTGIALFRLNLDFASAVGARFDSTLLDQVDWKGGDFTGACFRNTRMNLTDFTHVLLNKTVWQTVQMNVCCLTMTRMNGATMSNVTFNMVVANNIISSDQQFAELLWRSGTTKPDLYQNPQFRALDVDSRTALLAYFDWVNLYLATILNGGFSSKQASVLDGTFSSSRPV